MSKDVHDVVFCVPFNDGGCEYRRRNWKIVRQHLEIHHQGWPIIVGENRDVPFNIARARNHAAKQAGNWQIAVFVDCDTLVHPDDLCTAVDMARTHDKMVLVGSGKLYMNERSSTQYVETGLMFPEPTNWPDTRYQPGFYDQKSVYRNPCSGVVVVPRRVWTAVGGYMHNADPTDSYEDLVFWACCEIFGGGLIRVEGMELHLWHPPGQRYRGTNHRLYRRLAQLRHRPDAQKAARQLLEPFGHRPP